MHFHCELQSTGQETFIQCSMDSATIKLKGQGDCLVIVKQPPKRYLPCLLKSALSVIHQSGLSFKELEVPSLNQSYRDLGFKKRRRRPSLFLKLWDPV